MSWNTETEDGLDRTLSLLKRSTEALFYAVLIFALVCVVVLVAAGTFGIIHEGDDFGGPGGGAGNPGGDIIVLR